MSNIRKSWAICASVGLAAAVGISASANPIPFSTLEISQFLIVGMGPNNTTQGRPGVGTAFNMNNFELGANKAPTPSTSSFLTGGSSGGPGLLGNVPNIPMHALPVSSGVCGNGNVAITHVNGRYNLQDVGVYADKGIWTAGSAAAADNGTQNSFHNDPHMFPNTFTPTGFTNPGVHNNTGGFGVHVGPGAALQSTRMDASNGRVGVTGNVDFSSMMLELSTARAAITAAAATSTLNVSGSGGVINSNTTINLGSGLNIIDIVTGGSDFKIENTSVVVNGSADSFAVFRIPRNANFLMSNANLLVGDGGIGLNNVLFFTDRLDNAQHFNFSNVIVNGISFWSLGERGGEINIDNAQGCTQLIADKITLNNTRFCGCGFAVPAPSAAVVLGAGLLGMARRRR
ncbi:MAG: PEP-CTERM sorting domain-containing protein [Phycisphaeraceae bacterium]|nr:PEP-CTERM sorting domain-containing protein [Phycisphaeraceae bacterium]MCW5755114.1 PEP-CTERM sorting domain-containing protein [Phycisphaeraceae bacterium]